MAATRPSTRERMIASTALLIRERGARATSIDDVLAHSDSPRGSVYHHFPGGREQLLREATDFAGRCVATRLERALAEDPLSAVDQLFDDYRASLEATGYRAGCPVVAVAVESAAEGPDLRDDAAAAFDRWRGILRAALAGAGIGEARSDELAVHVISSFEGALILSRAYRDAAPLRIVHDEVRDRIQAELMKVET